MGTRHDLEPPVTRRERGPECADVGHARSHARQGGVDAIDVGVLRRHRDVEVEGRAHPTVNLCGNTADDNEVDAVADERTQQLSLIVGDHAHASVAALPR